MVYPLPNEQYTWEDYLEMEARSEERLEFHDGTIVSLAGATNRHNRITGNTYMALRQRADKRGCDVFSESVRLFRHQSDRYFYPDVMLTCNPLDRQTKNGVRSPLLVVEVISKSTGTFDYGAKSRDYLAIPSIMHYLVVEQEECLVAHFHRSTTNSWNLEFFSDLDQVIDLPELDARLPLSTIYQGIEFGPEISYAEEAAAEYQVEREE